MATKAKRLNALAALKAARSGAPAPKKDDSDSDNDIYDEVTEEEYKSIVRGRMMQDDFIEDDDGSGYLDNGQDDWEREVGDDDEDGDSEDAEEYFARTGRKKPKKKKGGAGKGQATIGSAFQRQVASKAGQGAGKLPIASTAMRGAAAARAASGIDAYRPKVSREKEDDFMARLMNGLEGDSASANSPSTPTPSSRSRSTVSSLYQNSLRANTLLHAHGGSNFGLGSGASSSAAGPTRKRKPASEVYDSTVSRFGQTSYRDSSSPSTAPSSDPPEFHHSDDAPHVHIAGSDSPPWDVSGDLPDFGLDDQPSMKKSKRNGSAMLGQGIESMLLNRDDVKVSSAKSKNAQEDEDEDDEDDDFSIQAPAAGTKGSRSAVVNAAAVKVMPKNANKENIKLDKSAPESKSKVDNAANANVTGFGKNSKPLNGRDSWKTVSDDLEKSSQNSGSTPSASATTRDAAAPTKVQAFEDDKTLRFFWMDYSETADGIIHLIGKIKDRRTGKFVSACLTVEGIERCLFLQPRQYTMIKGRTTDKVPTEDEIEAEFEALTDSYDIGQTMYRMVERHYAFEVAGVPQTGKYMKIRYGFDKPALPLDVSGKTFARIFGTNTSAFELFVVKRKIMGPCWLNVQDPLVNRDKAVSHCKAEFRVEDPKNIAPFPETDENAPKEVPPLNVMSITARTVVNFQKNQKEIVLMNATTWSDVKLEDPKPPSELPAVRHTVIRPLSKDQGPAFERIFKGTRVVKVDYERQLLSNFMAHVLQQDPDIIIGHELNGVVLDVLFARFNALNVDNWSQIGRLRKTTKPKLRSGFHLHLVAGRLLCDLSSDAARSMISSTTWSLTEMCVTHLNIQREDIDQDLVPTYFDMAVPNAKDNLQEFVKHSEADSYFQMALTAKVQILPLTKQLTNLAGNSWQRTLNGGRAERNEYILLHEFHRQKFICPDKISMTEKRNAKNKAAADAQAKRAAEGDLDDDEEGAKAGGKSSGGKKDKFKGGLVFEPKRGLWDKYILVMDFNSLYPSIIQEYNIDFTTVRRLGPEYEDVDKIPDVPSTDVELGVLPRLISTFVKRRRAVKDLMRDKKAPATLQLQWNIRQLALKLTANSMYGCLGFENSRFYARPLAALTTYKGREILTATKELAESLCLDVIYGDTDSVMINTNATDYAEAIRIGQEFKKSVNQKYRLLEIDIDGVFSRMLLLQKKKYAAIKVEDDGKGQSTEVKGLDMKRREYCQLSKAVSSYVLEQILSGDSTENVIARIHEYLEQMGNEVREGKIPVEDFTIHKRLGKNPKDYPDKKNQPHVQVALRKIAKGGSARQGDVLSYIFCLGEDGSSSSKTAQADRAWDVEDVRREGSTLKIDFEHYLALQILPPVERLCENIEGTERSRLAECLGLDASKYTSAAATASSGSTGREFFTLDSQMPDSVRFAECDPLQFKCHACGLFSTFEGCLGNTPGLGLVRKANSDRMLTPTGIKCPHADCQASLGIVPLAVQLELAIRASVARYYAGWNVCSEPSCGARSRMTGVYAKRCLVSGCKGRVVPAYTDKQLYTQLCYYESLVSVKNAKEKCEKRAAAAARGGGNSGFGGFDQEEVLALALANVAELGRLEATVEKYLDKCGRRYVALDQMFGFMQPKRRRNFA
ncbi:DNA-directed DNA polymerase alpha catalytic subunit pol1 [Tilletia horrida]|uniref:DNA polymerase n=1 Tax=Tilletia horrida TaxID=155126 RepID=A0AAN6JWY4_9BASI|nr:DNA-directed DNA polymerase alpha catalytic subunit pol1 [Tilletia horrida]KAK0557435.1 DNA-directed DNA polymerase alpha catalytic subunit pol1 [Tilletia horrida]KAK0569539.1 DNA-directed DNA polymerase alpha catalytic subunit pol1 [Tilletia horrida]